MVHRSMRVVVVGALLGVACSRAPLDGGNRPEPERRELHFAGDVYFGEAYRSALSGAAESRRYEGPLAALRPVLATAPIVANFESTFSRGGVSVFEGRKDYLHWSSPEATASALSRHGFVGVSLGNNHAMDYGLEALLHTRERLEERGLRPFGAGSSGGEAREPYEIELALGERRIGVTVIGAYWYRSKYEAIYRFYADGDRGGVRELSVEDVSAQIHEIKEHDPDRLVVIYPHWGRNYHWRNETQRDLAHALVDAGADLIIGHGAHLMQEVERYRGRWILYGLGNLVFLTPGRYRKHEAAPYSMLATIRWTQEAGELKSELILRFIASDNLETGYTPHFVGGGELEEAVRALKDASCDDSAAFCSAARVGADGLGPHLRLPL